MKVEELQTTDPEKQATILQYKPNASEQAEQTKATCIDPLLPLFRLDIYLIYTNPLSLLLSRVCQGTAVTQYGHFFSQSKQISTFAAEWVHVKDSGILDETTTVCLTEACAVN